MKRIFAVLFALSLILTGCGSVVETESGSGSQNAVSAPAVPASQISINEVMPDNKFVTFGTECDWVELYNAEETEIKLDGYYLTDNQEKLQELPLNGKSIPAGGYLVIVLDESAPFRLSGKGESVYLICNNTVISEVTFPESENGESFDKNGKCLFITPNQPNTKEGSDAYLAAVKLPELIISEVMSSNSQYLPQKGQFYDMVEVMNNGTEAIDLSKYTLTDKHSEPNRYKFPAVTLQPGEFYTVYCSGNIALGQNHTSFKIGSDGETLYLTKDGHFIDALTIPADLAKNESYGRVGNKYFYFNKPSFGSANADGLPTAFQVPSADKNSGTYETPITLALSGEGDIYYTLDGTTPTLTSAKYSEPITINTATTVRTFCTNGSRTSALTSYTYIIGAKHTLPIVHIAIPQGCIDGEFGVINHPETTYEYAANVTLLENGEQKFSVPFGFRLHGHGSRYQEKQSFQLRFRSKYGQSQLNYKLFDDLELEQFNSLLLKGGSERWSSDMMCDELATAIAHQNTQLYTQAMKPVVLYLGSQFWGIYYFRERFSDDYVSDHFDVSEGSVHILNSTGAWAQKGSAKEFTALKNYVSSHDMSTIENYNYLAERIDVYSLMDWYICRTYMGDKDIGNIRRFKSDEGDGKWRWMYFDLDWAFVKRTNEKPITWIMGNNGGDKVLINGLLASEKGKDLFLKRYAELMGTVLNETYIIGKIDSIAESIKYDMEADRKRWGKSYKGWEDAVERLRVCVRGGVRDKIILTDIKNYFKLTESQMTDYFGTKWQPTA